MALRLADLLHEAFVAHENFQEKLHEMRHGDVFPQSQNLLRDEAASRSFRIRLNLEQELLAFGTTQYYAFE